jgi:azurin
MKNNSTNPIFAFVIFGFTFLASCGENTDKSDIKNSDSINKSTTETVRHKKRGFSDVIIESTDQMKFTLSKIEVNEGDTVQVTFINSGKMPKEAMGHNWTLLSAGVNLEEYATEAAKYKDNQYQVKGREKDVIAFTKILGPGEKEILKFPAPNKGNYKFICTFPGHYGIMQGDFIVK